ncbi:glycerate kinase [Alkalicoccus luteus]|uniref:Glycerate kinase n=1 Tax=Alkalicoccus luteus TaxID=1237094 RepID=A0A969PVN1_9BACI|nr:glycerate kinase [Alkalicoccus luteus]NJP38344.1 glycerate kinase [Alkalicoccus luteus]
MNVIIAPDQFGAGMTSTDAAEAAAEGVRKAAGIEAVICPMADGHAGTSRALLYGKSYETVSVTAADPHLRERTADYYVDEDGHAFIDSEAILGLQLLEPNERQLLDTSSTGLGQVMAHAAGAKSITIALGGTASVDMGLGMLEALGAKIRGEDGSRLQHLRTKDISGAAAIQFPTKKLPPIRVLCTSFYPLTGMDGAVYRTGRQAGESDSVMEFLHQAVLNTVPLFPVPDAAAKPGSGAGGGIGFALGCLGAELHEAVVYTAGVHQLAAKLQHASLILTGESQDGMPEHTSHVVPYIQKLAEQADVPCADMTITTDRTGDTRATVERAAIEAIRPYLK